MTPESLMSVAKVWLLFGTSSFVYVLAPGVADTEMVAKPE